jgi:hypothetical protein
MGHLWLPQPEGPGPNIYIPQEHGGPVTRCDRKVKKQCYPLQNTRSFIGQLHSDVSIVRNSAWRLLLENLSARRLRSPRYYPKYQHSAHSSGFWARRIKVSHRDWDPVNRGAEEPQECFCLPTINWLKLSCYMGRFLVPKFRVKIGWTVNRLKLNTLLIILNANRRSDLTRDLTLSTLSSVSEVEGLPARGSSSTCSLPSRKACAIWTLKPWVRNVLHKPFVTLHKPQ